ncbi:hypothetical protein BC826DRAFT_1181037 [Russula brevipes]|nr:hypothetical protein BC826DRAFT_1181037 [Russula brevipes]
MLPDDVLLYIFDFYGSTQGGLHPGEVETAAGHGLLDIWSSLPVGVYHRPSFERTRSRDHDDFDMNIVAALERHDRVSKIQFIGLTKRLLMWDIAYPGLPNLISSTMTFRMLGTSTGGYGHLPGHAAQTRGDLHRIPVLSISPESQEPTPADTFRNPCADQVSIPGAQRNVLTEIISGIPQLYEFITRSGCVLSWPSAEVEFAPPFTGIRFSRIDLPSSEMSITRRGCRRRWRNCAPAFAPPLSHNIPQIPRILPLSRGVYEETWSSRSGWAFPSICLGGDVGCVREAGATRVVHALKGAHRRRKRCESAACARSPYLVRARVIRMPGNLGAFSRGAPTRRSPCTCLSHGIGGVVWCGSSSDRW